jgi:hypothetical protein
MRSVEQEGLGQAVGDESPTQEAVAVQNPTVGRIVHVRLSSECASQIGGNARAGDIAPAIVVAAWPGLKVNVRILGDGPGAPLWSTSLAYGDGPGEWQWPARV